MLGNPIKGCGLKIDTTSQVFQNKDCNCKNRKHQEFKDSILLKFNLFEPEICQLLCRKKINYNYVDSLLIQNDLNLKFSFLPIVNSRLNIHYDNGLGSIGLWGLNYIYALHNGLIMNHYIDERKDPIKSSLVAVQQLKSLRKKYKDTNWVLLAYWSSPSYINNIQRIAKSTVWESCKTSIDQKYLDKIILLNAIYKLDSLGFVEPKNPEPRNQILDSIIVDVKISFNAIYDLTSIDLNTIKINNPSLLKAYFPPNYPLVISTDEKIQIQNIIEELINYQDTLLDIKFKNKYIKQLYTVKEGDYLGKIAIDKKVSVAQIMKWNQSSNTTIYVGQQLVVYNEASLDSNSLKFQNYIVKKGDELWSIAQDYKGLKVKNILEHNNINELKEGSILKIVIK